MTSRMANGPLTMGPENSVVVSEPVPVRWWRLYESATLDQLVDAAFSANTELRMAAANLERSEAFLRQVRAAREPVVALGAVSSYQQLSAESYLHSGAVPTMGLYDTGVAVSYDIDLFGRLRRAVESETANDEATRAAFDLVKVAIAAETARAYADVCSAGEELETMHEVLDFRSRALKLTERLVKSGRLPAPDYSRAAQRVAEARAGIPALEVKRSNARYRLAALTGHTPAEYPKRVDSCVSAPRLVRPIPVGDGAGLLRRRPDVRQAERQLAAATAQIGVAMASLYPDITLGGSVGSTGAMTDFLTGATDRYGLGIAIQWQANQHLARARVAAAGAGAKLALARLDGVVLTALREVQSALIAYGQDYQQDADLEIAQSRGHQSEEEARQLYDGGKIGALTLLDAQLVRTATDVAVAESHARLAGDEITVFMTLGGGWE